MHNALEYEYKYDFHLLFTVHGIKQIGSAYTEYAPRQYTTTVCKQIYSVYIKQRGFVQKVQWVANTKLTLQVPFITLDFIMGLKPQAALNLISKAGQ